MSIYGPEAVSQKVAEGKPPTTPNSSVAKVHAGIAFVLVLTNESDRVRNAYNYSRTSFIRCSSIAGCNPSIARSAGERIRNEMGIAILKISQSFLIRRRHTK